MHTSFSHRARDQRSQKGSAMVLTLVTLSAMTMMATALVATTLAGADEGRTTKEELRARYVAEAGLSQSVAALRAGGTGAIGSTQAPVAYGLGRFWVDRTSPDVDTVRLTSTGLDDHGGARVELTLHREFDSLWRFGAFGDVSLHMDSNARVDSYNSTTGTYASQCVNGSGANMYAHDDGDVGSNGNIDMDANSQVWGDAASGPSGTTTVGVHAEVTGSTSPSPDTFDMPPIVVPALTSLGNKTINATVNLGPGNYRYDDLLINPNKILNVTGPATIVVTNLRLRSGAQFRVAASGGPVVVYVIDDLLINSNTLIASTDYAPHKLQFNLLSDNVIDPDVIVDLDVIDFDSNAKMYGTIYAPNAHVAIDSNFELFGAMIAHSIDLDSNSRIHYDESLVAAMGDSEIVWQRVCWRSLAY